MTLRRPRSKASYWDSSYCRSRCVQYVQPPLVMHTSNIMLTLLLWSWALPQAVLGQVENCTVSGLTYSQEITSFGVRRSLTCDISSQTYKWWRSTSPCGPFSPVLECNSQTCQVETNLIQRNFYYCCTTDDTVVTDSSSRNRDCYRIDFCTTIVSNQSKPSPSVAFFGQTLPVYIELYGHPIPALQSQPTVRLRYGVTQDVLPDNVTDLFQTVYPSEESSLVVNVFNIQVPNIDSEMYGHIIFSVTFETARGCPTTNSIMYTISVVGLEGSTAATTPEAFTTGVATTNAIGDVGTSCTSWISLFSLFLLASVFELGMLLLSCLYIVHHLRTRGSASSRNRPTSLLPSYYIPLTTSSSVQSTPVIDYSTQHSIEDLEMNERTGDILVEASQEWQSQNNAAQDGNLVMTREACAEASEVTANSENDQDRWSQTNDTYSSQYGDNVDLPEEDRSVALEV